MDKNQGIIALSAVIAVAGIGLLFVLLDNDTSIAGQATGITDEAAAEAAAQKAKAAAAAEAAAADSECETDRDCNTASGYICDNGNCVCPAGEFYDSTKDQCSGSYAQLPTTVSEIPDVKDCNSLLSLFNVDGTADSIWGVWQVSWLLASDGDMYNTDTSSEYALAEYLSWWMSEYKALGCECKYDATFRSLVDATVASAYELISETYPYGGSDADAINIITDTTSDYWYTKISAIEAECPGGYDTPSLNCGELTSEDILVSIVSASAYELIESSSSSTLDWYYGQFESGSCPCKYEEIVMSRLSSVGTTLAEAISDSTAALSDGYADGTVTEAQYNEYKDFLNDFHMKVDEVLKEIAIYMDASLAECPDGGSTTTCEEGDPCEFEFTDFCANWVTAEDLCYSYCPDPDENCVESGSDQWTCTYES